MNDEESAFFVSVGKRIKNARVIKGMSQESLAKEVGVTFQQMQKYESAKDRISIHKLVIISQFLEVSILDLLGLKDEQNKLDMMKIDIRFMRAFTSMPNSCKGKVIDLINAIGNL